MSRVARRGGRLMGVRGIIDWRLGEGTKAEAETAKSRNLGPPGEVPRAARSAAQGSQNNAMPAVKPWMKFFPPIGPTSPPQKKSAKGPSIARRSPSALCASRTWNCIVAPVSPTPGCPPPPRPPLRGAPPLPSRRESEAARARPGRRGPGPQGCPLRPMDTKEIPAGRARARPPSRSPNAVPAPKGGPRPRPGAVPAGRLPG